MNDSTDHLLAANRDLQAHIADLLAQRETLIHELRRLVDKPLAFYDGYVDSGCISARDVDRARAALNKVTQ